MQGKIDRKPILETQQNQLGALLNFSASIDAKALGLLATTVAVLIFIGQTKFGFAWWHWVVLLTPYAVSVAYNLLAIYPRPYAPASVSIDEHPEYLAMDEETLLLQLVSDTELAITTNHRLNEIRWRYCAISFLFALTGALVLLILIGVY